jgi:hypothetical protein
MLRLPMPAKTRALVCLRTLSWVPRGLRAVMLALAAALALGGCATATPASGSEAAPTVSNLVHRPTVSTQVLRLAPEGRAVTLDVHPAIGTPRGAAVLSHGFTRSRRTMAGHAEALARDGVLALTIDLPYTFDFPRNAQALADLVAHLRRGGVFGPPVDHVMLVGFSAGGLSSLLASDTIGVVGYVGLDPFDRVVDSGDGALGLAFAPRVQIPALLLRAPPSRCNAQAVAAPWAGALPLLEADRVIEGATHCDFESPSDWMCALACGQPDARRQGVIGRALLEASRRWMPGDPAPAVAPSR